MELPDAWAVNWLNKTARTNFWRVASWHDLDDLIQDGYWMYCRIVRKYPHITERRHIMGLFQRGFMNHIHNLAKHRTRLTEETVDLSEGYDVMDELDNLSLQTNPQGAELPLEHVLHEAPPEARMVLELIIRDPNVLLHPYRRRKFGQRETMNQRLCRMLNLTYDIDLVTPTRNYLHGLEYKVPMIRLKASKRRVHVENKLFSKQVGDFVSNLHSTKPAGMLQYKVRGSNELEHVHEGRQRAVKL